MKKALIHDGKIVQIAENEFPVSPEMEWIDCPNDTETGQAYINKTIQPLEPIPLTWEEQRKIAYIEDDCTLERFSELTLEGNTALIASLKERHSAVRLRIPKPS
jgi:hypothetical protein